MTESSLLVGDIGGTNARFALADRNVPGYSDLTTLQCADYATADAAIKAYLESVGAPSPEIICLAVAGPVIDQTVQFTNNPWRISAKDLAAEFAIPAVSLLNDFAAIAHAIPYLSLDAGLLDKEQYTVGIVGPGTGLGTAGLRKQGGVFIPISAEAGHAGFAPETELQLEILSALHQKFDRVSVESLVSGPGLENIYWALGQKRWPDSEQLSAAEIFAAAGNAGSDHAVEAVQLFFEILGQFAGDLALMFGAEDGVFIAGGIVHRYPELFAASRFRAGFENKGSYRSLMERIPTQLIMHPQPGLLGASYVALELFRGTEVMPTS